MLKIELSNPSPEPSLSATLAALSRNASVISTSESSSDSGPSALLRTPPRPIRNFSSPRSSSPQAPSPRASKPPSYTTKELKQSGDPKAAVESNSKARSKSRPRNTAVNVHDFQFGAILGEGSYSTVISGVYLRTGQQYAIKVLDKGHLIRKQKMNTALAEKNALVTLGAGHPGIVRLYYAFHDEWSLYFVIDLATNGEMQSLISRMGSLCMRCAQYYAAQIVDAMDYMHSKGVIHRDLKPENLLLDEAFRIKITDFGTGKIMEPGVERAKTFVGTAQYVSPELLESNETSKSSDFWALGCIVYQMIAGQFAFQGLSEYLTWQKIKLLEYSYPDGFDEEAKDLVDRLLVRDPAGRLGVGLLDSENDMHALRSHSFFASVNWEALWTDPAPPLQSGLVKRDHLTTGPNHNWEDVGAVWDELVAGEGRSGDEVGWASDGEGSEFQVIRQKMHGDEVGPLAENRKHLSLENEAGRDSVTITGKSVDAVMVESINVRTTQRFSLSAVSPSTSSEGTPVEKLAAQLESMNISHQESFPDALAKPSSSQPNEERGRSQVMSPVQGNGPTSDIDLSSQLDLWDGEVLVFSSTVEAGSLRRRASRLLPIPVPPVKSKTRQLILTTQRLVCLKRQKEPDSPSIKSELTLRAQEQGKETEKESRALIIAVELKTEKEFLVLTPSKTYSYATQDSSLASSWVQNIHDALASHGRKPSKART